MGRPYPPESLADVSDRDAAVDVYYPSAAGAKILDSGLIVPISLSPRPWGWSDETAASILDVRVVPTPVGMVRSTLTVLVVSLSRRKFFMD